MKEKKEKKKKKKELGRKDRIRILKGISDVRRYFQMNEDPVYFISATNFNLLGADEWLKGFKFISYIDCFDGDHPNVFSPSNKDVPEFQSIEEINNYLLEHKEVVDYIKERGGKPKAMFLMFDEETEALAEKLGMEVIFPKARLRSHLDNKVVTNRVAEKAGVPCVPYVLSKVDNYAHLLKVAKKLGNDLVVQTPYGDSGHTTFFIKTKEEFDVHKEEIVKEKEVKIMKRINCRGSAIEACIVRRGVIVAPLMTELVGFPELTPYKGGWCGNEIYPDAFTKKLRNKARKYAVQFGEQLRKEGYKGYFELDFLIDQDSGELYLGELNPRITGASSITNHAVFALADIPLFLFHILQWMDVDSRYSVKEVNDRWSKSENIDSWGQLIIKHTDRSIMRITEAPRSGIYKMDKNGKIFFSRMDSHRRAVEAEGEAFFLRILRRGDYWYEGADMGILVMRGRLMTDDYQITDRAKMWISAIRSKFRAEVPQSLPVLEKKSEIGSFKMN